jgi:hypothetical protein
MSLKLQSRLVSAACAACLWLPGFARAADVRETGSTGAYLQASYAFAQAELNDVQASAAAIVARANTIARECPSALTFAPRDAAFGEVAEAIGRSVWLANVGPAHSATLRFANRVAHLRWADRKLTQLVRAIAARERWVAIVALPKVCPAVAVWRKSAYTALPKAVGAFLSRQQAIESAAGFSEESFEARIERQLRRYEDPGERRLAGKIERLERVSGRRLDTAQAAALHKLEAALGASPL